MIVWVGYTLHVLSYWILKAGFPDDSSFKSIITMILLLCNCRATPEDHWCVLMTKVHSLSSVLCHLAINTTATRLDLRASSPRFSSTRTGYTRLSPRPVENKFNALNTASCCLSLRCDKQPCGSVESLSMMLSPRIKLCGAESQCAFGETRTRCWTIFISGNMYFVWRPNSNFANKQLEWGHHYLHLGIDPVMSSS